MSRGAIQIIPELRRHLKRGGRYLIAVSGGVDSVVLLHAAASIIRLQRLHIEVIHIHHGLRETAGADADFVKRLSERLGLPFHFVRAPERPAGVNVEAWGREIRYSAFSECLSERKLNAVLTAHTASDAAETLLMRLVANKEPGGIAVDDEERSCLRPLLRVPRSEILRYARANRLEWREDPTNADTTLLRNRVRLKLLPLLEREFDERIVEVLAERAEALQDDMEVLRESADGLLCESRELQFGSKVWLRHVISQLRVVKPALQWRIVARLCYDHLGVRIGRRRGLEIAQFLLGTSVQVDVSRGIALRRAAGGIVVQQGKNEGS